MQGLLPLKELSVCEMETGKSTGQEDHAFRIAGQCLLVWFELYESQLSLHFVLL